MKDLMVIKEKDCHGDPASSTVHIPEDGQPFRIDGDKVKVMEFIHAVRLARHLRGLGK